MCDALGQEADSCKMLVEQYGPEIIQMIINGANPQAVCSALKLCTQEAHANNLQMPANDKLEKQDGPLCDFCVENLQKLEDFLTDPNTEKQIEQALKKVCSIIPDQDLSAQCKQDVEQWVPNILQLLVDNLDPKMLCTQLKLCSSLLSWTGQQDQCSDCKNFVRGLQKAATDPETIKAVLDAMDSACDTLGTFGPECKDLAKGYVADMLKGFAQSLDGDKICKLMGLCSGSEQKEKISQLISPEQLTYALFDRQQGIVSAAVKHMSDKQEDKVGASPQCVLCEFILSTIDKELKNNATDQEIIAAVEKVCNMLPGSISPECKQFVDQYGPAIIQLLANDIQPVKVCTMLGLCSQQERPTATATHNEVAVRPQPLKNDEECTMCRVIITYLDTQLKSEATKQDIEEVLETMCAKLPARLNVQQKCDQFVEQWGPWLVEQLAKELDTPDVVCSALGLCSPSLLALHSPDKCHTFGFAYWCSSKEAAAKCAMEDYCQKYFWKAGRLTKL